MTAGRQPSLSVMKARWRDQVYADRNRTPATFCLAYGMAECITMDGTAAYYKKWGKIVIYPSQAELGKMTKLSIDTIAVGIECLIANGHLKKLRRGNQYIGSNEYLVIVRAKPAEPRASI